MRQVVLDTETTGLDVAHGHRIIEIGCVEILNRRLTGVHFHAYLQPDRDIDAGAVEVHGITRDFLADKPRFKEIAAELLDFLGGAELIIHNAPFDLGFLDSEIGQVDSEIGPLAERCSILDTLELARKLHAGQKNTLDALCKRYGIDNSQRTLHGALLDAEILADLYLAMSGGQVALSLEPQPRPSSRLPQSVGRISSNRPSLMVIAATADECAAHERYLDMLDQACAGGCVWRRRPSPQ
jgi:DNA polymerase-3 subunit epsilon